MKKLLIVLMVVAMSSFLLVGCLDGVTPEPTPEPESGIKTEIPEIDSVSGDANKDGYINDTEEENVKVIGHAIDGSLVRLYLDGDVVATDVATKGAKLVGSYAMFEFTGIDLGDDGAKALYVTAKQIELDESDPSTAYKFTLDTEGPELETVKIDGSVVEDGGLVLFLTDDKFETLTAEMNEAVELVDEDVADVKILTINEVEQDPEMPWGVISDIDGKILTITPAEGVTDEEFYTYQAWTYTTTIAEGILQDVAGNTNDDLTFELRLFDVSLTQ